MIPTRLEIQNKIEEIRHDPTFSTLREDFLYRFSDWLDSLDMPDMVFQFGQEVSPKSKILEDLDSYERI